MRLPAVCGMRLAAALLLLPCAAAQSKVAAAAPSSSPAVTYDVATIKPNRTGSGQVDIWTETDSYRTRNVPLRAMLQDAFDIQKNLIHGLPDWAESARWDVSAKSTEATAQQLRDLPDAQRRAMLRQLLEDRFAMKWHWATATEPVFDLVVDKGGVKIQHTTAEQAAKGGDGVHASNTTVGITNTDLQAFCKELADIVQKPVLDKTGLTGHYTFTMNYTPDRTIARAGDAGLPADAPPPLFTALPEQLGLRLEAGKGEVQTLVIDSLTAPSEN